MAKMDSSGGEYPPAWKPDNPESTVGTVKYFKTVKDNFGQFVRVCTIGTDDRGDVTVWVTSTTLKQQFESLSVTTGDRIKIEYLGTKCSRTNGRPYRNYLVEIIAKNEKAA